MNLRDLKYFIAVAELKHFGKAAKKCYISQPTLSMQLKKLEDELGVKLFERDNKNVYITDVGSKILNYAMSITHESENIKKLVSNYQNPFAGDLTIGVIPTIAPYLLPKIMPELNKAFTKLRIFLYEGKTEEIVAKLGYGELDAIILALPIEMDNVVINHLYTENFLLATHKNHTLAKKNKITPTDIKNQEILLLTEGHCFRDQALEFCNKSHAKELQAFQATSLETLRQMVASNIGITLIPELACDDNKSINYIKFTNPQPNRDIGILWRKTSVKQALLDSLTEKIKILDIIKNSK